MDKNKLDNVRSTLNRLQKDLQSSLRNLKLSKEEAYLLGMYFPILELSDELLFLMASKRFNLVPIGLRCVIEFTLDVSNTVSDDNYLDEFIFTALSKAESFNKYIFDHRNQFDPEIIKKVEKDSKDIAAVKKKLKERGIKKPINGLLGKFKKSTTYDAPIFYWGIDRYSQEMHNDIRLTFERYQDVDNIPGYFEGPILKPIRTNYSEEKIELFLITIIESICISTRCITERFSLKYNQSILAKIELFQPYLDDYSKRYSNY